MSLSRLPLAPRGLRRGSAPALCISSNIERTVVLRYRYSIDRLCKTTVAQSRATSTLAAPPVVRSAVSCSTPSACPLAPFRFRLEQLPPQLRREFDVDANQRALRHLRHRTRADTDTNGSSAAPLDLSVTPSTVYPVVWRCTQCQSQWSARPSDRANPQLADVHRCPQCYGGEHLPSDAPDAPAPPHAGAQPGPSSQRPTAPTGVGLLCDAYPLLAAQWDPLRNQLPQSQVLQCVTEVHTSSASKVWWRCPLCCSPWLESVSSRVAQYALALQRHSAHSKPGPPGTATSPGDDPHGATRELVPLCPSCERRGAGALNAITSASPRRFLADDTLLLGEVLLRPHQDPRQISLSSEMTLQWRCHSCQFEYAATVANRFLRHERCPQCSGRSKSLLNLLVVQRPDVVREVSKHISRTRLRYVTVHDDIELSFVCRTCYAPYRMTARARCTVPRGVPACSKCFLTSSQVLTEAQQQHQHGGVKALSARARRRMRQRALQLSRSNRHKERLAATANELSHRDNALKD
ncbi:putative Zinc-ribbon domain containing protein [Leishmania utingensis]|uniref:Zinc-ribbon domain containing protein n=1 Tax=Leishmania utingensis TaxID=653362 RepID=A0AAW3AX54_9TRYP